MIDCINLLFVDKLLSDAKSKKIAGQDVALYLNCVLHLLRNLEPSRDVAEQGYYLDKSDIQDFGKLEPRFQRMAASGLVELKPTRVYFPPLWIPYFEEPQILPSAAYIPAQKVDWADPKAVNDWITEKKQWLSDNQIMRETVCMQHRIADSTYESLIDIFVRDQANFRKEYANDNDLSRHFAYWLPSNRLRAAVKTTNGPALLGES